MHHKICWPSLTSNLKKNSRLIFTPSISPFLEAMMTPKGAWILCNLSKRIGDIHHFGPPKEHGCKTPGLVPAPSAVKAHLFVRRRKAKTSPGSTPSGKTITWWHRTVEPFKNETRPPYLFSFRWGWCTLVAVIWDSRERLLPGSHVMILPDLASLGCSIIGNHPPHPIPKLFNCSSEQSWASVLTWHFFTAEFLPKKSYMAVKGRFWVHWTNLSHWSLHPTTYSSGAVGLRSQRCPALQRPWMQGSIWEVITLITPITLITIHISHFMSHFLHQIPQEIVVGQIWIFERIVKDGHIGPWPFKIHPSILLNCCFGITFGTFFQKKKF